jgi:cobalt-zinc-cadmium resistance protein CzcA
MVRKLIEWAVHNPLIVILLTLALAGGGGYAFWNVNVEAYPDPAPAIIEVIAQYPGASAEEVERQVTIPLEVTLAGMPGLKYTRSKSLFGLAHLRNQFEYGIDYYKARQETINRLQFTSGLPAGVTPQISPTTPTGELIRYTLASPRDPLGHDIYTLNDLKSIQDWTLEREFRRVPRVIDVTSFGGTVKRYEIRPDPERLRRYGITLQQLQNAIANSNGNVGGDILVQGRVAMNVRGVGLIGNGQDPMRRALSMPEPRAAARAIRSEEDRRVQEIRNIVITSVNNVPVRVEDVVEGGPYRQHEAGPGGAGVVTAHQTRFGRVSLSRRRTDAAGREAVDSHGEPVWVDEEDKVQGIVLMRKGEATLPALRAVKEKMAEVNANEGRLLPGVQLETHFDLTHLIDVTTETVLENLLLGMGLVTIILLLFLNNVRTAFIVAINIPLALLFAFSVLFLRGKSANLLSIGAVDFGIIVDSSVIMVENIYRHLKSGEHAELPLRERIIRASQEVDKALFFSTAIMVCAFIPLFTMQGPEGQIFGPMADTYAFALGGALVLSLTVSPVLCLLLFQPRSAGRQGLWGRFFRFCWRLLTLPFTWVGWALKVLYVRQLYRWTYRRVGQALYGVFMWQLNFLLDHRWLGVGSFAVLTVVSVGAATFLGQEFMPELEEGNLYVRGTFPVNVSLEEAADKARRARAIMRQYPEVELIASQVGRPDDGTDPTGFYNVEFTIPLKLEKYWPAVKEQAGWRRHWQARRSRTKAELTQEMNDELKRNLIGVDWNFSQYIRDNVMESLSGVKGDNSVKIIGPDLDELERLAERLKNELDRVRGVQDVGIFRIKGQPNLEISPDPAKCSHWGVSVADVNATIKSAVGGQAFSQMTEGEKTFDIVLRWPERLRASEQAILDIPVDVANNTVTPGPVPAAPQTPLTGPSSGTAASGSSSTAPALSGSIYSAGASSLGAAPRRRLRDLVTPLDEKGRLDPDGHFIRPGASTIFREQGNRLIAVKFSVRDRDLAGAVAEAQERTKSLFTPPYRAEWSGEFQEMEEAEKRLLVTVSLALGLIVVMLYLAFHSVLDALVVLSYVLAMSLGGVWTLLLTGINFNISAAVGFISILGVAVMNGLLLVSSFNRLRAKGLPLREAIVDSMSKLIRPVAMTALAAIFGLLPAAFSTRIGSQSQRPLAIVVVGGMITTLLVTNLVPLLYSFYGKREPPEGAGGMAH